jgi:pimeloyl-ACP methyl ester carboxylesterase
LNASITDPIKRTLLISPAPTLFKAMSLFSGPTFAAGLENALDRSEAAQVGTETASGQALSGNSNSSLWLVFGDADDFTGAATLRALGGRRKDLVAMVEIPGCGHFYARDQDGVELRKAVTEWISSI